MSRYTKDPLSNSNLDAAYQAALVEAGRGSSRKPTAKKSAGAGLKHIRWIGKAQVHVTYRGPRQEADHLTPMYRVTIIVDKLRHKLSVAGSPSWYEDQSTPSSPEAIDAAAGGAVRVAVLADDDTPDFVATTISVATLHALQPDGNYEVKRKFSPRSIPRISEPKENP